MIFVLKIPFKTCSNNGNSQYTIVLTIRFCPNQAHKLIYFDHADALHADRDKDDSILSNLRTRKQGMGTIPGMHPQMMAN